AKSRVHILIVGLKPVPEARSQHASSGARRSALHDVVFAIKKVGRVTAIERKCLESGEGTKDRGRPLPTVAEQALHSESALAQRMRIHRSGVPMGEVEIPQARIGSVTTPRIASLRAVRTGIGRSLPLLLSGKALARPLRVGARFRMTNVNRPIRAKWNLIKHCPVEPDVIPLSPED